MGAYIKGMRPPENCSECPVALSGKYCRINKKGTIMAFNSEKIISSVFTFLTGGQT